MSKNTSVWLIIPQTNLHVGNESVANFSVIDKAVQRDAVTNIPCINSSSLKGALKEYLFTKIDSGKVRELFGSVKGDRADDTRKGRVIFFDANLIAFPRPCSDEDKLYEIVYCDEVIDEFIESARSLGATCSVDDIKKASGINDKNGQKDIQEYKELCNNESLPIIARNCLENGESVNLWYEQVVPSKSVFATLILTRDDTDLAILDEALNNNIVQIGANATIGYGYCKMMKL